MRFTVVSITALLWITVGISTGCDDEDSDTDGDADSDVDGDGDVYRRASLQQATGSWVAMA